MLVLSQEAAQVCFDYEVAAWATWRRALQYVPAATRLDGSLFKNRQDLEAFGFTVIFFVLSTVLNSQLMWSRAGGNPASAPVRLQL